MVLSFAMATHGALQPQSNGSPLPPGVRSTLIMFLSANVFPASLEIETWHSAMRSSLSAFVSIGKLYCRQATATRLGFDRLTATWGNTEANFGVFLLMLVKTTPGVAPGSGGVWPDATIITTNVAAAVNHAMRNLRILIKTSCRGAL